MAKLDSIAQQFYEELRLGGIEQLPKVLAAIRRIVETRLAPSATNIATLAFDSMSPCEQAMIVLHRQEYLTTDEIAERLGTDPQTVVEALVRLYARVSNEPAILIE